MFALKFLILLQLMRYEDAYLLTRQSRDANLKDFVRVIGSVDPNETLVVYINGTIYGRLEGHPLQTLFWLEGYNINRKVLQEDGGYWSLSREFLVYRDFKTRQILQVSVNPFTNQPNEVFPIANNPVNGKFPPGTTVPIVSVYNDIGAFDSNYILEYPNPMDPKQYPQFSAGSFYDAAELFTYYFSQMDMFHTNMQSIPFLNTWSRRSQFLPWMGMGQTKGSLFYSTLSWKCTNGLSSVSSDILNLINAKYKEFLSAPKTYDVPNETSWTVFKSIIDDRRKRHLPDIIIPETNVTANITNIYTHVDKRVIQVFERSVINMNFTGTVCTEIYGKPSVVLFGIKGNIVIREIPGPSATNFRMEVVSKGTYYEPGSNVPLRKWTNMLTNQTIDVPPYELTEIWNLTNANSYTMSIADMKSIALSVVSNQQENSAMLKQWSVTISQFIFQELDNSKSNPRFYGTYHRLSSWDTWMKMGDENGSLVLKSIFARQ